MNNQQEMSRLQLLIRKFALRYVRSEHDLDDVTQEALLKLSKHQYRSGQAASSYVKKTVRSVAIDYLRKRAQTERLTDSSLFFDSDHKSINTNAPSDLIPGSVDPDIGDLLNKALSGLTQVQRQALLLRGSGYTYLEISSIQNTKIGTIRSRIYYARRRAQQVLKPLMA